MQGGHTPLGTPKKQCAIANEVCLAFVFCLRGSEVPPQKRHFFSGKTVPSWNMVRTFFANKLVLSWKKDVYTLNVGRKSRQE